MPLRSAAAAFACILLALAGCAADKPDPVRPVERDLPMAQAPESEKGQGNLSFHYANKSTDANLAIDLSSTDVYLEMTGKAAQEQIEQLRARTPERKPGSAARKAGASAGPKAAEASGAETAGAEEATETAGAEATGEEAPAGPSAAKGQDPDLTRPGKGLHKAPPRKPEPQPEEEPAEYEDVTAKVLSGIRRAQELFYQKRYPEAMQAVRSSQDARPTAEGYALQGSIHFMQGQIGMARRQWMEALRLNPDMPAVVNMLERTRTPGGRGSPSPRPVYRPPARAAEPEAPYPEEGSVPAPEAVPAPAEEAPMPAAPPVPRPAKARPVPAAPPAAAAPAQSPPAPSPVPAAQPTAASAATRSAEAAPAAPAPSAEEAADEEAVPAPEPSAPPPAKPVKPVKAAPQPSVAPKAAPVSSKPAPSPAKDDKK